MRQCRDVSSSQAGEPYCHLREAMQRREQLTGRSIVLPSLWDKAETWATHRQENGTAICVRQCRDVNSSQTGDLYFHLCEQQCRDMSSSHAGDLYCHLYKVMQIQEQQGRLTKALIMMEAHKWNAKRSRCLKSRFSWGVWYDAAHEAASTTKRKNRQKNRADQLGTMLPTKQQALQSVKQT